MATRSGPSAISGANDAVAVTPHATNPIETTAQPTSAITCSGDGTAAVRFHRASADVTVQLNAGQVYPYQITHVRVSGTTATGIVALYN